MIYIIIAHPGPEESHAVIYKDELIFCSTYGEAQEAAMEISSECVEKGENGDIFDLITPIKTGT